MIKNRLIYHHYISFGHRFLVIALSLISAFITFSSHANDKITIEDLIASDQLTVNSYIQKKNLQIVGQPVTLVIEVATNRWFAKGTKIENFNYDEMTILTQYINSFNGSKQIEGEMWATQTQELTLYPRHQGQYKIPPVSIHVSVNTEKDGVVEGNIATKEHFVDVTLPQALAEIDVFIVSPSVNLTIDNTPQMNTENHAFSVGDAITQVITITSKQSPAMMIPPIKLKSLPDLTIYRKNPKIFDKTNRGELTGTRIESFSIIFEKKGHYIFPSQNIFWWNSDTETLEKITIPSLNFTVNNGVIKKAINRDKLTEWPIQQVIFWVGVSFSFILLVSFMIRHRKKLLYVYAQITHLEQRKLVNKFKDAVKHQQYALAYQYLYSYAVSLKINHLLENNNEIPTLLMLKKLAFDSSVKITPLSSSDTKHLLHALTLLKKRQNKPLKHSHDPLKLN